MSQDIPTSPVSAAKVGPMLHCKAKKPAAAFPQTIPLEQEMLWGTALVQVINLSTFTCTTGNPVVTATLELEDSGRTSYAWSSLFSF